MDRAKTWYSFPWPRGMHCHLTWSCFPWPRGMHCHLFIWSKAWEGEIIHPCKYIKQLKHSRETWHALNDCLPSSDHCVPPHLGWKTWAGQLEPGLISAQGRWGHLGSSFGPYSVAKGLIMVIGCATACLICGMQAATCHYLVMAFCNIAGKTKFLMLCGPKDMHAISPGGGDTCARHTRIQHAWMLLRKVDGTDQCAHGLLMIINSPYRVSLLAKIFHVLCMPVMVHLLTYLNVLE